MAPHALIRRALLLGVVIAGAFLWWPRASRTLPPAPVTRAMMVLPLTGDAESVGRRITTRVESLLTVVPGVHVIPGERLPRRPHTLSDLRNVGTLINVGTILYGDMSLTGKSMRVTLRLGALPNDSALWSGDFTRDTAQAMQLAREIADSVARTLHVAAGMIPIAPADSAEPFRSARYRLEYSRQLANKGMFDEALREARRAHELDPLDPQIHVQYLTMLERAGRMAEAQMQARQLRRINQYLGVP